MSRDLADCVTLVTVCHTLCHDNPWGQGETILVTGWVFSALWETLVLQADILWIPIVGSLQGILTHLEQVLEDFSQLEHHIFPIYKGKA